MYKISYIQKNLLVALLVVLPLNNYSTPNKQTTREEIDINEQIENSLDSIQTNPDDSHRNFTRILAQSIELEDTLNIIKSLLGLGDIERFRGNYEVSFEFLWEALLYANDYHNKAFLVNINRNLGILYDIYNQDSKAIEHLKESLNLARAMLVQSVVDTQQVVASYFSIATHYMNKRQYKFALNYLDSCESVFKIQREQPFVDANKGYIFLNQGKLSQSERHLFKALKTIGKYDKRYHIVIQHYIGDLKIEQNQEDSAMYYYLQSLRELEIHNAYIEFKPDLLQKLSSLYQSKGQYQKSYSFLEASKTASDSLFSLTNRRNNQLFEIKSKYQETLIEQEKFIEEQNAIIEEKSKVQFRLKVLSVFILLLSISIYMLFTLRTRIKKLALMQSLEKERSDAILKVKNKELATYALQMIEKDQTVSELLETLKTDAPTKYNSLHSKHTKQKKKLWEDFNIRFLEINSNFYKVLREKHPDLTQTEQKHAALIKLNFDSIEMSQILNISLQSVHTSRYRIRKKINLGHDESLSAYIDKF